MFISLQLTNADTSNISISCNKIRGHHLVSRVNPMIKKVCLIRKKLDQKSTGRCGTMCVHQVADKHCNDFLGSSYTSRNLR